MRRRDFIALLGGTAAALPVVAWAQHGERIRRVGVLMGLAENDPQTKERLAGFREGLERRGWTEGDDLRIDYRYAADGADRYQSLAKELVDLQPDVILAHSTPIAIALQRQSRETPIVFVSVSDPIGSGLVASLARPGGNVTGALFYEESITGKWLAMLKEIDPKLTRAALIASLNGTAYDYFVRLAKAVAPSLAIELVPSPVEAAGDIERAIASFSHLPNGGLLLPPDTTTSIHRHLIVSLAARYRLPAIYSATFFVEAGGLMSYGTSQIDMFRLGAAYVDRILRGDKPADLPVQAPTKYETAVNIKTAKMLGLTVPPSLLVAADRVIE
jgi:putative ABC transport system substrate-binding protein